MILMVNSDFEVEYWTERKREYMNVNICQECER